MCLFHRYICDIISNIVHEILESISSSITTILPCVHTRCSSLVPRHCKFYSENRSTCLTRSHTVRRPQSVCFLFNFHFSRLTTLTPIFPPDSGNVTHHPRHDSPDLIKDTRYSRSSSPLIWTPVFCSLPTFRQYVWLKSPFHFIEFFLLPKSNNTPVSCLWLSLISCIHFLQYFSNHSPPP